MSRCLSHYIALSNLSQLIPLPLIMQCPVSHIMMQDLSLNSPTTEEKVPPLFQFRKCSQQLDVIRSWLLIVVFSVSEVSFSVLTMNTTRLLTIPFAWPRLQDSYAGIKNKSRLVNVVIIYQAHILRKNGAIIHLNSRCQVLARGSVVVSSCVSGAIKQVVTKPRNTRQRRASLSSTTI